MASHLTPRQIVEQLDRHIIGQHAAKRSVAIALRNRWRRMNAPASIKDEIIPNNILMIGPTGVGKTEIARRLAKLANAPFIKIEATKYTEVGYVGRDVESIIRDLTDLAVKMVKDEMQTGVQKKAEELAEERILDILIPPVKKAAGFGAEADADAALNQKTRDRFREKLRSGELNERKIELDVRTRGSMPTMQIFGPGGMEEMGVNLQNLLGNLAGGNKKTRLVPIQEARQILVQEEAEKLIDNDAAIAEALTRVQSSGIVFIDEIDKIAAPSTGDGRSGPDVSRQGVQRDLLPIVEGCSVSTKYGMVKTDHILFIASGAFHISKPSDLIPELQGRFPIRVELTPLSEEDFYNILTGTEAALLKQYQAMMATEGVEAIFKDEAVREIARIAAEVNQSVENIGARRLHTILSLLLEELLYAIPDDIPAGEVVVVDKPYVEKRLAGVIQNRDLSQYIL
jgi:ATP-dependent HslUV protease ATP-binding subunit HslU